MPKRQADDHVGGRSAKLPTRQRKHLYLVLDDWELGYSIRKIDLWSGFDSDEADEGSSINRIEQHLPKVVFRLEAPPARSGQFTAFGTKIMFMGMLDSPWGTVLMYDVHTKTLTSAPQRELEPSPYYNAYVQLDGKLFALDEGGFEMLHPPPPPPLDGARANVKVDWSWHALPSPSYHDVVSHAVHPDGRTMVFSMMKESSKKGTRVATLSFDRESSQWTRHGAWELPFKGCGYFDRDLDAWVGLSGNLDTLGHICACDVLSADNNGQTPACKLSKEKLFCVDPAEKHIGATLVYVGDNRARFCLVQCFSINYRQGGIWEEPMSENHFHVLRVTTFSLKYDKYGDLRTAKHRHIGSYRLPETARVYSGDLERPVVFWM